MLLLIKISYVKLTFILITNYVVCYEKFFCFQQVNSRIKLMQFT